MQLNIQRLSSIELGKECDLDLEIQYLDLI